MNTAFLIGRLTKDPELSYTSSGRSCTRFIVAVDRFSKGGEKKADFISCIAWNKTAEAISKYSAKGLKIAIEGSIQTGSYKKDDGSTVYTTDVLINKAEFLEWSNSKNSNNDFDNQDLDDTYDFETTNERIPF